MVILNFHALMAVRKLDSKITKVIIRIVIKKKPKKTTDEKE